MSKKIVAIVNSSNELTAFEAGTNLLIFGKEENEGWQVLKEISYSLDTKAGMAGTRDSIKNIIPELEDCKIMVGKTVAGLSYNIFERMGFEIYEADSLSVGLLEEILYEIEAEAAAVKIEPEFVPTAPVMTAEEGVYVLDLILLQKKHPEISSKKALQSFIENEVFYRLDVICNHLPPWFDILLPQKKLTYNIEELEKNLLRVSVFKKICSH